MKNFNVTYVPNKENRCKSLLEQIGLMNRFIDNTKPIIWDSPDYTEININIEQLRSKSLNYLINAIKH